MTAPHPAARLAAERLAASMRAADTVARRKRARGDMARRLDAAGFPRAADRVAHSTHRNDWDWAISIVERCAPCK